MEQCTFSIDERLKSHREGKMPYTAFRLPIELITFIDFKDQNKVFDFEKYMKIGFW